MTSGGPNLGCLRWDVRLRADLGCLRAELGHPRIEGEGGVGTSKGQVGTSENFGLHIKSSRVSARIQDFDITSSDAISDYDAIFLTFFLCVT